MTILIFLCLQEKQDIANILLFYFPHHYLTPGAIWEYSSLWLCLGTKKSQSDQYSYMAHGVKYWWGKQTLIYWLIAIPSFILNTNHTNSALSTSCLNVFFIYLWNLIKFTEKQSFNYLQLIRCTCYTWWIFQPIFPLGSGTDFFLLRVETECHWPLQCHLPPTVTVTISDNRRDMW